MSEYTHGPGVNLFVKSHHMKSARRVGLIHHFFFLIADYRISLQMKTKTDQGREDLQWRMENILYFSGGGVLLIRNPYDAIRLELSHAHFSEYFFQGALGIIFKSVATLTWMLDHLNSNYLLCRRLRSGWTCWLTG